MDSASIAIISGNAHPKLAQDIAKYLHLPLTKAQVGRFSDGEFNVEILENIRGKDAYIVQSTCPPAAENLMELLVMTDACRRASANQITAVVPYFGFARQDRRPRSSRVPITAKLVARLFASAGIDRVLTVDLHAEQIQGFFDIPTDNLFAGPVFAKDINEKYNIENLVAVSPDIGGVVRARAIANKLGASIAIVDKRRPKAGESEVMNIIGDVADKDCIILDDIIDSAGTICNAADRIIELGASSITAYTTHGVLTGKAIDRIEKSKLTELVITDSINNDEKSQLSKKIRVISVSDLLGEAIKRISEESSVSSLFNF